MGPNYRGTQIEILQNKTVRRIIFKNILIEVTLYKEVNVLKFRDIVHLQIFIFMSQIEIEHNGKLPKTFPTLKFCGDNQSYNTRSATKKLLDILLFNAEVYGTQSFRYNCIIDWNNFRNLFPNIK